MEWSRQPEARHYVRQQNDLVEARYSLTARELKLVFYVCAMVDPHARDFGKCKIRVQDFAEITGVTPNGLYTELLETALAIRDKRLVLKNYPDRDEDGTQKARRKTLSWLIDVTETHDGDGFIKVTLHPDLKPYLLQLQRDFTQFRLGYAVRLESKYAIRLYQLLKRWSYRGQAEIAVDDLRIWLGTRQFDKNGNVIADALAPYKNFKARAIQPAVDELNEHSDLSVVFYEVRAKGIKTVAALRFDLRPNLKNSGKYDVTSAEDIPIGPEAQAELDKIVIEFGLSRKQGAALKEYVERDGLAYVLEKADIVRSRERDNAAMTFIAALRGDWKKPVPVARPRPKKKTTPPPKKPELPPGPELPATASIFEAEAAALWSNASQEQKDAWLQDEMLRHFQPKAGQKPGLAFLSRLHLLTQPPAQTQAVA